LGQQLKQRLVLGLYFLGKLGFPHRGFPAHAHQRGRVVGVGAERRPVFEARAPWQAVQVDEASEGFAHLITLEKEEEEEEEGRRRDEEGDETIERNE